MRLFDAASFRFVVLTVIELVAVVLTCAASFVVAIILSAGLGATCNRACDIL